MLKRLFPSRWARILAWTGAAVAWGTSIVTVQAATEDTATAEPPPPEAPEPEVLEITEPAAAVPAPTEKGLVVIRYTPVPPPPPEVITRTVTVGGGGGGGGAVSSGGGGGGGTTPRPTIKSSGS
jgi:hypothetical protein